MFENTKRTDDEGWRFDWRDDRGNKFGGLRFYPKTNILSSWSRRPHKAAKENYHPYVINDHDWIHIRQACTERWGGQEIVVVMKPVIAKPLIKMCWYEPAFGPKWVTEDKMRKAAGKSFDLWLINGMKIEER